MLENLVWLLIGIVIGVTPYLYSLDKKRRAKEMMQSQFGYPYGGNVLSTPPNYLKAMASAELPKVDKEKPMPKARVRKSVAKPRSVV